MLILALISILLSMAVTIRRDKSILYNRVTIIILLLSIFIGLDSLNLKSLNLGVGLYGGLFHSSAITHSLQLFLLIVSAIVLQLTSFYSRTILSEKSPNYLISIIVNKLGEQHKIIEYPLIILFVITGAVFLISSSDIISIFLAIELQSYGLYLLASLYRNSELATSAGLLYFLLGGFSSCFILLGSALLYVNSGTTSLEGYYMISNLAENEELNSVFNSSLNNYLNYSLLIMSIGFLFKISAAPFHFWSPDVYDAIPTIVTTFVAIIAKISILVFLLEIVYFTKTRNIEFSWTYSLLISSFLSLIIGTILGLNQFRIKRLFAYSTISHLGFILLALTINTLESCQAFLFYLTQYSISNLNAFVLLITIGYTLYMYVDKEQPKNKINQNNNNYSDLNNSPLQLISQLKGYFFFNPLLAISFAITIYSFVGIPPLIGFFAKQMVLSAAMDKGYYFLSLVAILTSVISAVYYLKIIQYMFMEKNDDKENWIINNNSINNNNIIIPSKNLTLTVSVLSLVILLFMLNPHEWLSMSNILSLVLFNN